MRRDLNWMQGIYNFFHSSSPPSRWNSRKKFSFVIKLPVECSGSRTNEPRVRYWRYLRLLSACLSKLLLRQSFTLYVHSMKWCINELDSTFHHSTLRANKKRISSFRLTRCVKSSDWVWAEMIFGLFEVQWNYVRGCEIDVLMLSEFWCACLGREIEKISILVGG